MLVVVSDGHYTSAESENAKQAVKKCRENGVAVLWITPEECSRGRGKWIVGENGVVLEEMSVDRIADAIGKSATEALARSAVM
jgi:Mg-chelatase subunit ChlD